MKQRTIAIETTIQQQNVQDGDLDDLTEQRPPTPVPSDKTPQAFYAEITRRADVRAILEELASG
ncbi:MAG: hypothetical protein ACRDJC_24845 [Thermomicrobiales bacterium]